MKAARLAKNKGTIARTTLKIITLLSHALLPFDTVKFVEVFISSPYCLKWNGQKLTGKDVVSPEAKLPRETPLRHKPKKVRNII
ncbi:MAG TPA: hypothetical protein DEA22_15240 [Blastocatellia bacterium]|nr:hypothetical protein [Blastocatellia bacterium]